MKKLFVAIFAFISLLLINPKAAEAQNTFTCTWIEFNGTFQCMNDLFASHCDPGYESKLVDGRSCTDLKTQSECQINAVPHSCLPPPPTCLPPNSCQRGGCANGAVQVAGTCTNQEDVCCSVSSTDCYNDCLKRGDTPSECRGSCNIPIPGGGGTTSSGGMIDLNALIDSMESTQFNSTTTLGKIVSIALPFLYTIAGIGLLLYLIAGGFRFLTSQGDPKKLEGAKNSITMAIVGFIIVIGAFFVTQIVNYIFQLGVEI